MTDDEILAEARKFYDDVIAYDSENRSNALADLEFLMGDQWDMMARQIRQVEQRPCLTINKLPAFIKQVTNDQRQNTASIKIHPVGDGADEKVAEILQGISRHIEYSSGAKIAYDRAINNAARIGFGYWRLVTDYCDEKTFDQEIRFRSIRNPFTVYFDPTSTEPDGSDQKRCLISVEMNRKEFEAKYPDAKATDQSFINGTGDSMPGWISKDQIRLGEYYRIEEEKATLCMLADGSTGWKSDLPKEMYPLIQRERESSKRKVMWYKITGADILEKAEIKCKWIPVFPVWGDEVDINGKVYRAGIIRNAKDPAKMYNVHMTAATEEVITRAKAPYIGAEGQFEGHEKKWRQANVRAFPYLEYKPKTVDGQLAPAPQRQPMADVPTGMLALAAQANEDIKATTGIYEASLGQRSNETSGVAIRQRERQGDNANFNFTDSLNMSVLQCGRCINDMIPNYYDATRIVRIMGEDGSVESAEINKPLAPEEQEVGEDGAMKTILNDLSIGEYDVTVSSGPAYQTLRQEAQETMAGLIQAHPEAMQIIGDLWIKAQDWPGHEEMAERYARTIPPQIKGDAGADPKEQLNQAMQQIEQQNQALQMSEQHMQELEQELQKAQAGTEREQIKGDYMLQLEQMKQAAALQIEQQKAQIQLAIEDMKGQVSKDVAELNGVIQILLQKMQPPPELAADVSQDLKEDD